MVRHQYRPFPTLPNEIWLDIFAYIAHIPGAYTVTDYAAIEAFTTDTHGVSLHRRHDETMETKLALCLVSSTWRELATRYVYEYILIKSGNHALMIAAALLRGTEDCSSRPGWWIKRVELATEGQQRWEEHQHDALLVILRNSPNMIVFSDIFCDSLHNVLARAPLIKLLSEMSQRGSLRRFESRSDPTRKGSGDNLAAILRNMPYLEVLLFFSPCNHISSAEPYGAILLPNLKMLAIGFNTLSFAQVQHMQTPSLQNVAYMAGIDPCTTALDIFLSRHAAKVERLHLWNANPTLVASIISMCTSLKIATLNFSDSATSSHVQLVSHPHLQRINIVNAPVFSKSLDWYRRITKRPWEILRDFLYSLISREAFHSLQTIGFFLPVFRKIDEGPAPDTFTRLWDPWMQECEERGIILEASVGSDEHTADVWQPFHPRLLLQQF